MTALVARPLTSLTPKMSASGKVVEMSASSSGVAALPASSSTGWSVTGLALYRHEARVI
jgi:hypothetical protein